jgi:membrane-associated phospholipid phosphatase
MPHGHIPHPHLPHPHIPHPHMLLNRRRVLIASLTMLFAAVVLSLLVANPSTRSGVQVVDDWWRDRMQNARWHPATRVFEALTTLGAATVSWTVRGATVVVLLVRRRFLQLSAFVGAVVTSELCIGPLKAVIDRPRPPGSLIVTSGASYPSGHAIAIAVTAIGVVLALLPPGRRRLRWELLAALLTFLIALSRTYLGAHWLTDVLGGSLIGAGLALFWPAALEQLRARTRRTEPVGQVGATAGVAISDDGRRAS